MKGVWLKFGEGPPPVDGEALVFMRRFGTALIDMLEGRDVEAVVAVHRYGMLHEQNGNSGPLPTGCLWTSLPSAPAAPAVRVISHAELGPEARFPAPITFESGNSS